MFDVYIPKHLTRVNVYPVASVVPTPACGWLNAAPLRKLAVLLKSWACFTRF